LEVRTDYSANKTKRRKKEMGKRNKMGKKRNAKGGTCE
jgi:hypothetical protein